MLRALVAAMLALALGWTAGGQSLLGRIDPALVVPLLLPPMLLLGWWQRDEAPSVRRRTIALALAILLLGQSVLALWLAGSPGWVQLVAVSIAGAAAAFAGDALMQWRTRGGLWRSAAALVLAIGWFAAGHAALSFLYRPFVAVDAPAATMLTGLPLRWSGGNDLAAMIADGANEDPALARLEAAGPVSLVDSLVDHVPPRGGALLLAHPRALAPRELAAIDAFIRGGGRAVVLADALSGWPVRHPLGDPRNPPVTSLLTPLLDHWGITLDAAPVGETQAQPVDVEGARLRLFSAGKFDRLPRGCRTYAGRRVAMCRIDAGEVWLVGDADLLFAPLWEPPIAGAWHLRRADTMDWLAAQLWRDAATRGVALHPLWVRTHGN